MGRKYPASNVEETLFLIKLSLLRSPSTFCEILHYVYFVTATFSLWTMCRSHQITILKSIGRSPQQILYPFLSFAAFLAMLWLFAIHPAGLLLEEKYYANKSLNTSCEVTGGIWIDCPRNKRIIFIKNIYGNKIDGLSIFDHASKEKIFAKTAQIADDMWTLKNAVIIGKNDKITNIDSLEFSPYISRDLIELLSKNPRKRDIYKLYKVHRIQKKDKVSLRLYEMELHKLLANCFSFFLFALMAATICFPINRYKTKINIAIKVISSAIFVRFFNSALEFISYEGTIPVQFACWALMLILSCISIALLIWREA
jgi:lipopolysaccharide export LptBFGC system permease protein LptF